MAARQEAFKVRAQFPRQRKPIVSAMIEVTHDELVLTPPVERRIIHSYGETINSRLLTYSLEEIVVEKLRGILRRILQITKK